MACLENAGIRDYSARLEHYGSFYVADRLFAIAVKALADVGFESCPLPKADEATMSFRDQRAQRIATATKRSEPFTDCVL